MAVTAEQDHVVGIQCDVRIVDVLRRDVYFMMDSVAMFDNATRITLLAQPAD